MAAGLNPFDGVIIPTFGSMYLTLTLLFPFVAIRTVSEDKQSGALRLLLQMPLQSRALLPSKVVAMLFAWLLVELPGLLTLVLWRFYGGHLCAPEVLCLLLGQFLYGTIVIGHFLRCRCGCCQLVTEQLGDKRGRTVALRPAI
jgi:ABC-2 type transport system permease protein